MDMNWLETTLFGFISGLAEILPVSARTHNIILLKVFGAERKGGIQFFLIHLFTLLALYFSNRAQIIKMSRNLALARIPKKRRRRPLDVRFVMDFRFLRTMAIPVILAYCFYGFVSKMNFSLLALSGLIFLNGVLLYIPQFFPTGNKDSRTISRLDGLYMGLGGAISILPGFSAMGSCVSVGSICGLDRGYALNMSLLINMLISALLMFFDVLSIVSDGIGAISISILLWYFITATAAFIGTRLGVRIMRMMVSGNGYSVFSYYCWGVSLFIFILNLMA